MKHYPETRKADIIAKMTGDTSLKQLAQNEKISLPTLYAWRRDARANGVLLPNSDDAPEGWSSLDKFNAVLQTSPMDNTQIAEFCRAKGLHLEQLTRWKIACEHANDWDRSRLHEQEKQQRTQRKEIKTLQADLRRKDSALAETTAILVLRKKFNALLGEEE